MGNAVTASGMDAHVSALFPSTNYGTRANIAVRNSPAAYSYIWFKIAPPAGATVLSAKLRLYGIDNWGETVTVTVQRISATWKETTITYNNRPGVTGATASLTQTNPASGTLWEFDVTALVQAVCDGAIFYGFRLSSNTNTAHSFYAIQAGGYRSSLSIEWSDAPDAPTTLAPDNNNVIGIAKPLLRFDYTDVSGSTTLASVQVQIDSAADWVTPEFDSGEVVSTLPELDLATTAYAGLANTASTYWRVRVKDAAGLWSAWSSAAQFQRQDKAALTITNPAADPNDFVSEWTPPISWSFAGTQTTWAVMISAPDSTEVAYNTGWRNGTDTSHTLPEGVLTVQSATYTVWVYVWDDQARENTPNDPPWIIASRTFTFVEDPTPDPVATLAATQPSEAPFVTLTFTRATAPDSFAVVRDGVCIATGLVPADLLTEGTTYQWVDRGASAQTSHTWVVQCVVNNAVSADNPTIAYTPVCDAIWIVDPVTGDSCPILDGRDARFEQPEIAAVYEPVGTTSIVRVVQTQRGLQGQINGRITAYAGSTAATWAAKMRTFKLTPNSERYLYFGNMALRVLIGSVTIFPLPGAAADVADRGVSFAFWSLDGV